MDLNRRIRLKILTLWSLRQLSDGPKGLKTAFKVDLSRRVKSTFYATTGFISNIIFATDSFKILSGQRSSKTFT